MSKIIQVIGVGEKMFALADDGTIYRRYVYDKQLRYSEPTYRWAKLTEEGLPAPSPNTEQEKKK